MNGSDSSKKSGLYQTKFIERAFFNLYLDFIR